MSDTDSLILKETADTVTEIDMRYRQLPTIDEKEDLKPTRDEAFSNYTMARLKLLEEGVITTQEDIDEMKKIRGEIEKAANVQTLIAATGKVAAFLAKLALRS